MSHTKASATQVSLATSGAITNTFADWTIGTVADTSDNTATATDLIISLTEVTEGAINGATATILVGGSVLLVELNTAKTYGSTASETTNASIFYDDSGMYGSIDGGGAGDTRDDETVNEGVDVTVTSGSYRAQFTRLHWLS